jgi:hypothetical protein
MRHNVVSMINHLALIENINHLCVSASDVFSLELDDFLLPDWKYLPIWKPSMAIFC